MRGDHWIIGTAVVAGRLATAFKAAVISSSGRVPQRRPD
jgi:hypothetical protein